MKVLGTFAGWKMLYRSDKKYAFMNPFGGHFEVKMPLYIEKREKKKALQLSGLLRVWYHSMSALDKGVRIIEVALYYWRIDHLPIL